MKLPALLISLLFLFLTFPQQIFAALDTDATPTRPLYHLALTLNDAPGLITAMSTASTSTPRPRKYLAGYGTTPSLPPTSASRLMAPWTTPTQPTNLKISISPTPGSAAPAFVFVDKGKTGKALVVSPKSDLATVWGVWLICNWSKNAPELFVRYNNKPYPAPRGCADIDLIQVLL
ncbi:hypothetical protein K432DRAFT_396400 [Lepidopterella palustris CBS 459.81]|uniref:DUF7907 domain-containing protein n=1 Tax=Lepidopterella palustris CBS 459.81 TaxID=1314670 RepID=A0A8E2JBL7_9PEZI|nr:hypothetical protein K432DRAFT_396400 [Lepidopterella palustris CBS 459.81]